MEIIYEIILETTEFLTLFSGIAGIIISLVILFSLDTTKKLSNFFNSTFNLDKNIRLGDRHIQTDSFFYRNNLLTGIFITVTSGLFILFLFFRLDTDAFLKTLSIPKEYYLLCQVVGNAMVLFAKISGIGGFVTGIILMLYPDALHKIENKMNRWISSQHFEEKLNEVHKDTDTILFLHPLLFGTFGLITSAFLTILSILNLLR